jgi:hypothetical protein
MIRTLFPYHWLFLAVFLASCASNKQGQQSETMTQGIAGQVLFWEGDFMPGITKDGVVYGGQKKPVVRQIFVHEATSIAGVERVDYGGFYRKIRSKLVAETWSDSAGMFAIPLPEGKYSLFIWEDSLYYANGMDGTGTIGPVDVEKDSMSKVQFDITYKATF